MNTKSKVTKAPSSVPARRRRHDYIAPITRKADVYTSTQVMMSPQMRRAIHAVQMHEHCAMSDVVRSAIEAFLKAEYEWAWNMGHGIPDQPPARPEDKLPDYLLQR